MLSNKTNLLRNQHSVSYSVLHPYPWPKYFLELKVGAKSVRFNAHGEHGYSTRWCLCFVKIWTVLHVGEELCFSITSAGLLGGRFSLVCR